jgi:branched-chain amino acid transport system substrate-binding protein
MAEQPRQAGSESKQAGPGGGRRVDRRKFMQATGAVGIGGIVAGAVPGFFIGRSTKSSEGGATGGGGDAIKIGASLPLTAWGAAEGDLERKAIDLAVKEENDRGGVLGRPVEAVVLDVGDMSPQKMVSNFRSLISREGVHGIGFAWHLLTGPEYPVVAEAGIPYLHVNTQEANARQERENPEQFANIFQCCPTEVWYGRGFPRIVEQLVASGSFEPRNETIAIVAASDPYGMTIATEVRDAMREFGWTVSLFERIVAPVSEWGPVLSKIRRNPPDIIFNTDVAVPDIAAFVKQFSQNPTNSLVYGQYGPSQPQFRELAGEAANGVIWSSMTSLLPGKLGEAHRDKWRNQYDSDPGLGAAGFSYDMVKLYLRAVAIAGDPEDYAAVSDAIRRDRFRGVDGTYVFDDELTTPPPYPDVVEDPSLGLPHCYFQIQDGEDMFIGPTPYQTAEFQLPPWFT